VQLSIFWRSWMWRVAEQHTQDALWLFYCNSGYANALQFYVVRTLPISFFLQHGVSKMCLFLYTDRKGRKFVIWWVRLEIVVGKSRQHFAINGFEGAQFSKSSDLCTAVLAYSTGRLAGCSIIRSSIPGVGLRFLFSGTPRPPLGPPLPQLPDPWASRLFS